MKRCPRAQHSWMKYKPLNIRIEDGLAKLYEGDTLYKACIEPVVLLSAFTDSLEADLSDDALRLLRGEVIGTLTLLHEKVKDREALAARDDPLRDVLP